MSREIVITVPARPQYVHVLRTVVSGVAARFDFPYDAIEDLKIAIDEACAQLLGVGGESGTLSMRILPSDGTIEVVTSVDAEVDEWPPERAEDSLAWKVLEGLTDGARWERLPEGPAVRVAKQGSGA